MVADPLELVGHVVEGQQVAQVAGDRLLGRDGDGDEPRNAALGLVDDRVALDHVEGEVGIVRGERPARLADRCLDERAHAQDRVADQLLLAVEGLARRGVAPEAPVPGDAAHQLVDLRVHGGLPRALAGRSSAVDSAQPNRPDT